MLNDKAQQDIPQGISEYLLDGDIEKNFNSLKTPEKYITNLISVCGVEMVTNAYRKGLSRVGNEERFLDILHEIVLVSALAIFFPINTLRPPTGKGTYCDFSIKSEKSTIYGEVKRMVDRWFLDSNPSRPIGRSIEKAAIKPSNSSRPRSMDLHSKLKDVYKQFPDHTINILFIFLSGSFGQEATYLQQALYGDNNFFNNIEDARLYNDGLFSRNEWQTISGVCFVQIDILNGGRVVLPSVWKNPRATLSIPDIVHNVLNQMKPGIATLQGTHAQGI